MVASLWRLTTGTPRLLSRARLGRTAISASFQISRAMATAVSTGPTGTLQGSLEKLSAPLPPPTVELPRHLRASYAHLDPSTLPPGPFCSRAELGHDSDLCKQDTKSSKIRITPFFATTLRLQRRTSANIGELVQSSHCSSAGTYFGYVRLVRLQNGLEALLVSDPEADKAAAALTVRVGHLSDPVCTRLPLSQMELECSPPLNIGGAARSGPFLRASLVHGNKKGMS
jgi:hypothetical protein